MSSTITLPTKKVVHAITVFGSTAEELGIDVSNGKSKLKLEEISKDFIQVLISSGGLTSGQILKLMRFSSGSRSSTLEQNIKNTKELYLALMLFVSKNNNDFSFMYRFAGRFYPVTFNVQELSTPMGHIVFGNTAYLICDQAQQITWSWSQDSFVGQDGQPIQPTLRELLKEQGIEELTQHCIDEFKKNTLLAKKMLKRSKTLHDVTSDVLVPSNLFWKSCLEKIAFGSKRSPRKVIIETELESDTRHDPYYDDSIVSLPFVRAFSLDLKKYVYINVDSIKEHEFDSSAKKKLVLRPEMQAILDEVFRIDSDDIFGDMFGGRHGGMIILANGASGVGKTLTAEVYSEHTKRPLYVLEMGELGTSLDHVEQNLTRIFLRAKRWNAILLFDECDIFLSKRGDDLDRNAIVGVFLRLLDHYDGAMFLTTNRASVIDDAFKSRITLKLDYPNLDSTARRTIWKNLFEAAHLFYDDTEEFWDGIDSKELNGRQIRNIVRLLKIMCGSHDTTLTNKGVKELFQFNTN